MANPWLKKNPFMSLWLSAANRVAGVARGQATALAQRQANAVVTEVVHKNAQGLAGAVAPPAAKKKKKTSRRR